MLRFKAKPSDLPYSIPLLITATVLAMLTTSALIAHSQVIKTPFEYSAAQTIVFAIFYFLILAAHKMNNRFVQSATAIFGVNVFFQVLTYILSNKMGIAAFSIPLTILNIALHVYIIKETLNASIGKGLLIYLGLTLCSSLILLSIFPEITESLRIAVQAGTSTQ